MTTITFTAFGAEVTARPEFARYANGRLAIKMVDAEDGSPWATLTVNMPDDHLADGEVFIKDWAENEEMVLALIDAGWIEYTGREVQAGFAIAKAVRLAGDLDLAALLSPIHW